MRHDRNQINNPGTGGKARRYRPGRGNAPAADDDVPTWASLLLDGDDADVLGVMCASDAGLATAERLQHALGEAEQAKGQAAAKQPAKGHARVTSLPSERSPLSTEASGRAEATEPTDNDRIPLVQRSRWPPRAGGRADPALFRTGTSMYDRTKHTQYSNKATTIN